MISVAQVRDLTEQCLPDESHFIVDVSVSATPVRPKVTVILDADQGVSIDECARVSRCVGRKLDELVPEDYAYVLEVTSPGADQPLQLRRQYPRHVGRTFQVTLDDGSTKTGRLKAIENEELVLDEEIKEGKNKTRTEEVRIPFAEIRKSQIVISFK